MNRHSFAAKLMMFTVVTLILMIISTFTLYLITFNMVKSEITKLSDTAFIQIQSQVDTYLNESADLVTIFSYNEDIQNYLESNDATIKYEKFKSLDSLYIMAKSIKPNLKDLILFEADGNMLSLAGEVYNEPLLFSNLKDRNKLSILCIQDISPRYSVKTEKNNNLIISCPVYHQSRAGVRNLSGYISFILDMKPLIMLMDSLAITKSAKLVLYDQNWNYVTGTSWSKEWKDVIKSNISNSGDIKEINSTEYLYLYKQLGKSNFIFVCLVPQKEIYSYSIMMKKYGFLMISINVIIIILMAVYINKSICKPIKHFLNTIIKVQKGNINERARINDKSEIGNLANNFDEMMDRINNLTNTIISDQTRMYELQLKNNEMELIALQNQINPHFLYNTLACIKSIAICNKQQEISIIAKALANLYNYILRSAEIVTVANEIEIVKSYINIYKIRIGDRLNSNINIEPIMYDKLFMKLVLQPLVENAIEHGILEKIDGGTVTLNGNIDGKYMVFSVKDNGKGMSAKKVEEILKIVNSESSDNITNRTNFGMYNIITRLKLMYKQNFVFICHSEEGQGTEIILKIPLQNSEARENKSD